MIRAATAVLHFGEEPPLVGQGGSGTLFFTGCPLQCSFCQNRQISSLGVGRAISIEQCAALALEMQRQGAASFNLVSGTPFIPSLIEVVRLARDRGLSIPVVWNSSGYETLRVVSELAEVVDIFLPDMKSLRGNLTGRLSGARDYPEITRQAILRMTELKPLRFEGGQLVQGTIVRHLVLPGLLEQTREVLDWYAAEISSRALLSLMVQFGLPEAIEEEKPDYRRGVAGLENRVLEKEEYGQLITWLSELGIDEGFVQEPGDEQVWWPDFSRRNPFPPDYSVPVWSWLDGPPATG